jgi:hypothetical protein
MARVKSAEEKADAKAARAVQRADEQRAKEELRNRRARQLESARSANRKLEEQLRNIHTKVADHKALMSHLVGFYEEIDKLTKGKALLEVTPLVVDQANDVIRDAKAMVEGDVYLNRVKEFVPAGNNPIYPDVLVVLRTVRQGLERWGTELADRIESIPRKIKKAKTIATALEYFLEEDASPSKEDLEAILGVKAMN